jgi:hypothetical protein
MQNQSKNISGCLFYAFWCVSVFHFEKKKSIWAFKRASKKAGVLTLAALFAAGFFCVHTCMFSV